MSNQIKYNNPNLVSVPAPGAIERDCTEATLVLDMENTLGEVFHWEVEPEDTRDLPTRNTSSAADKGGKVYVLLQFPAMLPVDTQAGKVLE